MNEQMPALLRRAKKGDKEAAERQKAFLIKEGVEFTEIPEDSDYYDYPPHGPDTGVTE